MPDVAVLDVLLHGRLVGTLTRLPDDRNLFVFDPDYVSEKERETLSLSFKGSLGGLVTDVPPTQTRLPPFFSNLLPEGSLREYLAARAGVKSPREFFLAWVLGRDLPGAVQIVPGDGHSMPPESGAEKPRHAASVKAKEVLRFSLAGVQLKFSAVQKVTGGLTIPAQGVGGSWIVKLPSEKFAGVPENEFAMMELAKRVGVDVPEIKLVRVRDIQGLPSGIEVLGDNAFAIQRFDRTSGGERVHIEDFAQVFGVFPNRKYERASYQSIARVLAAEAGESAIVELVRRLVFSVLIGNADMHLKNWSLIYPDQRTAQLAPAYDFVSTIAYLPEDKLALTLAGSKQFADVTLERFERFAAKAALPKKIALDTVKETVAAFRAVWRDFDVKSLTHKTRRVIDKHLNTIPLWNPRLGKAKRASAKRSTRQKAP